MAVLLFAENSNGLIKKAVFQAASYAHELAATMGQPLHAVILGDIHDDELLKLAEYGVEVIHHGSGNQNNTYNDEVYVSAVAEAAKKCDAKVVVLAQTYNGKSLSPRLSIRMEAGHFSGVISMADAGKGFMCQKLSNSGKGIETRKTLKEKAVLSIKVNAWKIQEKMIGVSISVLNFPIDEAKAGKIVFKEIVKASAKISITEADVVVSGGRGLKGPEHWGILEELATALGAGTACSKPVADMHWRPHHEHVGQTGIQIAPNLYIALGISGAIQHLAGVNSSKNIVVINKDPEAPFFKIADYGIVGDVFEVLPKITARAKQVKASS